MLMKEAQGRKEILKHQAGEKLTTKQAILGKCMNCMGFYEDGKIDCEIPNCTLYGYMPYGKAWKNRVKNPEQAERTRNRFKKAKK